MLASLAGDMLFLRTNKIKTKWCPQLYRRAVEAADVDFLGLSTKNMSEHLGWVRCPQSCIDILMQSLLEPYACLPLDIRFRNAMLLDHFCGTPDEDFKRLMQALGPFTPSDLIAQRDAKGRSILTAFFAKDDGYFRHVLISAGARRLILDVVQAGINLHDEVEPGRTILSTLLSPPTSGLLFSQLHRWLDLLLSAGVDLLEYGKKEKILWQSEDHGRFRVHDWTFGSCLDDWDITLQAVVKIPLYESACMPGYWPQERPWPAQLLWHPQPQDVLSPPWCWEKWEPLVLLSAPFVAGGNEHRKRLFYSFEQKKFAAFQALIDATQDDCGAVQLLISRSGQSLVSRRSQSEPRSDIAQRRCLNTEIQYWLPEIHADFLDAKYRLVGSRENEMVVRRHVDQANPQPSAEHRMRSNITERMNRFHRRYPTKHELDALPYRAYHPVWSEKFR